MAINRPKTGRTNNLMLMGVDFMMDVNLQKKVAYKN
jgi:hypothetical protein